MAGHYTKLVVIATVALFAVSTTVAFDFGGFNFCNMNPDSFKACSANAQPASPECCGAIKGVDPKCICFLINAPFLGNNKDEVKQKLTGCGVDPNLMNCPA